MQARAHVNFDIKTAVRKLTAALELE